MLNLSLCYQATYQNVTRACQQAYRTPDSLSVIAVSKTQPIEAIMQLAECGQRAFGENYLQEAIEKIAALHTRDPILAQQICWHFIGPIQSNKTKDIAKHFTWVHSVDRLKVAERLSQQRSPHAQPLNICLQVNISNEPSKSGVAASELPELLRASLALPHLRLRGLMAVPAPSNDFITQRQAFAQLRELMEQVQPLCQAAQQLPLDTLSMGMSHDMAAAVAEGATFLRLGTAFFGERV